MIASLRGSVGEIVFPNMLILDVGGVGYLLHCPTDLIAKVSLGAEIYISVFTSVREDAITLYGFESSEDKSWFEALKTTQGVGPSLALSILSTMSRAELAHAISAKDQAMLVRVPGVGAKTASRLIVEMQGRLEQLGSPLIGSGMGTAPNGSLESDLRLALAGLGFGSEQIRAILAKVPPDLTLEEMLRFALKELSV